MVVGVVGVVTSCVLCARVSRVLRDVLTTGCIPCATENTYIRRRVRLRHHVGNQALTCGQLGAGIRGTQNPGLNSIFSKMYLRCHFACQKFNLLAIDGGVNSTLASHHFLMDSCCTDLLPESTVTHCWRCTRPASRASLKYFEKDVGMSQRFLHYR